MKIELSEGATVFGVVLVAGAVLVALLHSCASMATECVKSGGEWHSDKCVRSNIK